MSPVSLAVVAVDTLRKLFSFRYLMYLDKILMLAAGSTAFVASFIAFLGTSFRFPYRFYFANPQIHLRVTWAQIKPILIVISLKKKE